MAVPSNTFETFDSNSMKESFEDIIYNIAPTEVPFLSGIGKTSVSQTLHEWSTDSLADAASNAQKEGDDYAALDRSATVKLSNRTVISAKAITVSGTVDAVDQAGKSGTEMAYQLSKAGRELKRDMEHMLVGLNTAVANGSSGTARNTASLSSWYGGNIPGTSTAAANFSANSNSANPNGAGGTAFAGGTNRTFTEALLKGGVLKAYTLGGNPEAVLMSPSHKQIASGFTGVASKYQPASEMTTTGAVDLYISDFGTLSFVPDRYQNANRVDILQMDTFSLGQLRPFATKDLASAGDNEKKLLTTEWCLIANSPNANYGIFNLTA